ncbi:MAG: radical SAM protein [Opitutae bacterium]|jgi:pyruvate-formate lyase-activating enzyme|nr:radical SAM protein [Opitutae bacterium]
MNKNTFIKKISQDYETSSDLVNSSTLQPPTTLMLELTNACNLACIMCRNPTMKREKGFMSEQIIKKAFTEGRKLGIKNVALYTTGESLYYKNITNIIKQSKSFDYHTYLTSNGLLLNRKKSKELIEAGLDSIKISIDGTNKKEYEKIRIGGKFERLLRNLEELHQLREEMKSSMKIYAAAIITKVNEANIKKFKDVYGPFVDGIFLSPLVNMSGQLGKQYEKLKPSVNSEIEDEWRPCKMLWDRMVITKEGLITACCVDYENDLVYADLNKVSLKEAWESTTIKMWRQKHKSGNIEDMNLCKTCNAPMIQQVEVLEKTNSILID